MTDMSQTLILCDKCHAPQVYCRCRTDNYYQRYFLGRMDVVDIGVGCENLWRLDSDFGYQTKAGQAIVVPAGFAFDGASIPRFAWDRFGGPMSAGNAEAALVHDWLREHIDVPTDSGETFPLAFGDNTFLEMLLYRGKSRRKAVIMWLIVRAHGLIFRRKHELAGL